MGLLLFIFSFIFLIIGISQKNAFEELIGGSIAFGISIILLVIAEYNRLFVQLCLNTARTNEILESMIDEE